MKALINYLKSWLRKAKESRLLMKRGKVIMMRIRMIDKEGKIKELMDQEA